GLERLVLDEQPLIAGELSMQRLQALLEPAAPLPDVGRARIVRSVRKPERDVAALQRPRDRDAVLRVLERVRAHRLVRVAKRSELVDLILKDVRIDRTGLDAGTRGECRDLAGALDTARKIPEDVQRDGGTHARQRMHLT